MKQRDEDDSPVIFQKKVFQVTKSVKLQITQCCDFNNVLKMHQLQVSVNLCTKEMTLQEQYWKERFLNRTARYLMLALEELDGKEAVGNNSFRHDIGTI